jgi:hypothetical protein
MVTLAVLLKITLAFLMVALFQSSSTMMAGSRCQRLAGQPHEGVAQKALSTVGHVGVGAKKVQYPTAKALSQVRPRY